MEYNIEKIKKRVIYLIQRVDHLKLNEDIYKIGRTENIDIRIKQYPPESKLLFTINSNDLIKDERILIKLFTYYFTRQLEIGLEYFKGDLLKMISLIQHFFSFKLNYDNLSKNQPFTNRYFYQCDRCLVYFINKIDIKRHLIVNKKKCISKNIDFHLSDEEVYELSLIKLEQKKNILEKDKEQVIKNICNYCYKKFDTELKCERHKKICKLPISLNKIEDKNINTISLEYLFDYSHLKKEDLYTLIVPNNYKILINKLLENNNNLNIFKYNNQYSYSFLNKDLIKIKNDELVIYFNKKIKFFLLMLNDLCFKDKSDITHKFYLYIINEKTEFINEKDLFECFEEKITTLNIIFICNIFKINNTKIKSIKDIFIFLESMDIKNFEDKKVF